MAKKQGGKSDSNGIIGFRLDAGQRNLLEQHAQDADHSVHEEARRRVVESFGKEPSEEEEAESAEVTYLRDRMLLLDDKVNGIARDITLLAYLILTERAPMTEEQAREYLKENIASYALGKRTS